MNKTKLEEKDRAEEMRYGRILDKFIAIEREKSRIGSGDDLFYELKIMEYVNSQRAFWISFIEFIENEKREW